ncbi:MAG: YjbH domain-containing protein, partial [Paracoccaceae bacterium]
MNLYVFRLDQAVFVAFAMLGSSLSADIPTLSTYGTPGLVDLPVASALPDGHLSFGLSFSELGFRNNFTFQVRPRLTGTFRYTVVESDRFYDRSFDLQYQLMDETSSRPALAVGLRDIIGTGVYSSEYIVATKTVSEGLQVTGGLGWGRLAGRNSFANPLSVFGLNPNERQGLVVRREEPLDAAGSPFEGLETTGTGGQIESGRWFQGPTSFFAGLDWVMSDQWSLQMEFSNDIYEVERRLGGTSVPSPINASVQYSPFDGVDMKAYVIGGENFGVQLNYVLNPKEPFIQGGREPFPAPIRPPANVSVGQVGQILERRLQQEGFDMAESVIDPTSATVYVSNNRWDVEAQAAGRVARVLANTLPAGIQDFTVVFQERGVPVSSVSTKRSDLEALQYDYDAAWLTRVRADVRDANLSGVGEEKLGFSFAP